MQASSGTDLHHISEQVSLLPQTHDLDILKLQAVYDKLGMEVPSDVVQIEAYHANTSVMSSDQVWDFVYFVILVLRFNTFSATTYLIGKIYNS